MDDSGRSDRARIPFAWLAAAVVVSVVATTFVVQVDNSALGAGGASNVNVVGKKFVKIDEGAKRTLMRNGRLQVRVNCPENNNPEVSIRVELRSFRNGA